MITRKVYAGRFIATLAMSVVALLVLSGTAKADSNLILNGNFQMTSGIPTSNEILNCGTLTDWCSSDGDGTIVGGNPSGKYNYVYFPGFITPSNPNGAFTNQDTNQKQCNPGIPGANGTANGMVCLYGPSDAATFPPSPAGGNFVALDADPTYRNALTQSVSGLTPGATYDLSFYWGGAQYTTRAGATTENIIVSLGGETQNAVATPINNLSGSFTGWQPDTLIFKATDTTELLSFLADGTPGDGPPVVVLDDVSLTAPEPGFWMAMVPCLGLLIVVVRLRRVKSARQSV